MPVFSTPYLKEVQLVTMALIIIVGLITTFRNGGIDGHAKGFLAIYYWTCLATLIIGYVFLFTDARNTIHFFRTMPLAMSLVMPAGYLYVRQTLEKRELTLGHLLHLSVFLIYAVDMFPFFMSSAESKRMLLERMDVHTLGIAYPEGWFMPTYGHIILRYTVFAVYLVFECRLALRMERKFRAGESGLNKAQRNWMHLFVFSQVLLMISPAFFLINGSSLSVLMAMDISGLITLSIQIYFLLLHPEVLYGDGFRRPSSEPARTGNATIRVVERISPDKAAEAAEELSCRLDDHMCQHKPYLRPGYKLRDLADETGISMARISTHINKVHGTNFSGYLNELRIEHAIGKMRDNEHRMKTLEAIAEESGFQNRITFIRAFKKSKGMIPSRFLEGNTTEESTDQGDEEI